MRLFTIGFVKKSAKEFFETLKNNEVSRVIDIRLNNKSQLAGFSKKEDLQYFLKEICNIDYVHLVRFAPTKELLNSYKKKNINWEQYEKDYTAILDQRNVLENIDYSIFENACLLCSEPSAQQCHRRLLAEYLTKNNNKIIIKHL